MSLHWKTFLHSSFIFFDLARRVFSTRFIKLHLPSHMSNSTLKIFNTTSEFLFTLQWSLIKTICRGVGHGWLFSPSCFARKCLPAPSHTCSVHFKWSVICVFKIPPKRDFFASPENFFLWLIKVSKSILFISFKFKKWKAVLCMITVIWIHTRRCFIFTQCLV